MRSSSFYHKAGTTGLEGVVLAGVSAVPGAGEEVWLLGVSGMGLGEAPSGKSDGVVVGGAKGCAVVWGDAVAVEDRLAFGSGIGGRSASI